MKEALKWIAGLLFCLVAFTTLAQKGFVSFIFFAMASAICIPPLLELIQKKLKRELPTWSKYSLVIGFWILGAVFSPGFKKTSEPNQAVAKADSASVVVNEPQQVEPSKAERIKTELEFFNKPFDESRFRGNAPAIESEAILFAIWEGHIVNGELDPDPEAQRLASQLKKKVIAFQIKELPVMRKMYAEEMRKVLWENDIDVSVEGKSSTILNLTGGSFVTNKNIKAVQETIANKLYNLRFKTVRYRWYKGSDEFTYYDLEPPADSDLVRATALRQ
jgi:hypothetical protein